MKRFLQVFYILFSALVMVLAIPNELYNFGSPILGLFALVPFYAALYQATSYRWSAFLTAFHFSIITLLSNFWLGYFRDFAIFTIGGPVLVYIGMGICFGCFFHGLFVFSRKSGFAVILRIFLFASLWTLWEWSKSIGFLAFPWGTIIMTSYRWKLLTQIVDITGTWGISFLFALFAAVTGEGLMLLRSYTTVTKSQLLSYRNCACFVLILFCISHFYGLYQYGKKRVQTKEADVVLVQQNADPWSSGSDLPNIRISEKLTENAIKNAKNKPDLICWSEAVLNYALPDSLFYYVVKPDEKPLIPFIKETNIPFLIGAPVTVDKEKGQFSNSAVYFDRKGIMQDYYSKIHLVPFAEYIPLSEYEWVRNMMETLVGFSDGWFPGTSYTVFNLPLKNKKNLVFSAPVCFEDAFPAVCRKLFKNGSEVFFNITNDSWSKTASAEYQHFVIASFRAQEFRTTLVRATNSGYTVVTDPAGKIVAELPLFTQTGECVKVPVFERQITFYCIAGDWLPVLLLVLVFIFWISASIGVRDYDRKRKTDK